MAANNFATNERLRNPPVSRKFAPLDRLPRKDPKTGDLLVVIETQRGSRIKYDYDPKLQAMRIAALLPEGSVFPYDFGFVPSTRAADGDPIDVLVLIEETVSPGVVVPVRLIGAIKAEQRKKGEADWTRNDRLLAVATHSHVHTNVASIKDIDERVLAEIEAFFRNYNQLKGGDFRTLGRVGPRKAMRLVEAVLV